MNEFNLMEELKKEGLEVAEDSAIALMKAVFRIVPAYVLASESKTDDLLIPVLSVIEAPVMALLDKIDGKMGD